MNDKKTNGNTSNMDAGTYNPETAQDTVVDAGLYINV